MTFGTFGSQSTEYVKEYPILRYVEKSVRRAHRKDGIYVVEEVSDDEELETKPMNESEDGCLYQG